MRTQLNVVIQLVALLGFGAFRTSAMGFVTVLYLFTLVGPVLTVTPLILAITTQVRAAPSRSLHHNLAQPFLAVATMLLAAGALVPDFGDTRAGHVPLLAVFGPDDGTSAPAVFHYAGFLSILGFLGCFVWLCVAVGRAGQNARLRAFYGQPRLPH